MQIPLIVPARRASHVVLTIMILSGWLVASPSLAPGVHADLTGCRSDPVVTLSNGVSLDLSADISDTADHVQQIVYTLHIPAGTNAVGVVGTDGVLGLTESFTVSADSTANTYVTETQVKTLVPGVSVSATTDVVSIGKSTVASVTGDTPQHLQVSVSL